jgi:hypothetical protein
MYYVSFAVLCMLYSVLWICIGFYTDPDPAFSLMHPNPDPCSQTNADPDPGKVYLLISVHFLAPGS